MALSKLIEETRALVYYLYMKRTCLSEVEKRTKISAGSLVSGLRRLSVTDKKWLPVHKFYSHQLYEKNKKYWQEWYLRHREEKKEEFKDYHKRISRKKPYRLIGEKIKRAIESRYGTGRGNIAEFADDLIEMGVIKTRMAPYSWISGTRSPRRKIDAVCRILSIRANKIMSLESRVN